MNISDLCWTNDSSSVLSASYDQTVKTWDINTSKLVSSFDVTGFALSVKIDPSSMFYNVLIFVFYFFSYLFFLCSYYVYLIFSKKLFLFYLDNYISYVGTSRNFIYKIDRRQSEVVAKFANNDAMVNSL